MTCDAHALLGHPDRTPGVSLMVAACARPDGHTGPHESAGMTMGDQHVPTNVTWQEADRRTYRGELTLCDQSWCVLPAGHRGDHAP